MNPAARVVPDVASFSVDDGFWYSVPAHLRSDVAVGSIVRVPLSGRRVRGWVVELADDHLGDLKEISGVSGAGPVFDDDLLKSLTWAAHHYVAPVSALLGRATPPNLPRRTASVVEIDGPEPGRHPLAALAARTASGLTSPVTALVTTWHGLEWLRALRPVLASGRSVLVVAASVAEIRRLSEPAREMWGDSVAVVDGEDDASDTAAWEAAQTPPRLVLGTPKTATWHIANLGLVVVLEESRRAMKDRQTPTLHVREVAVTRSRLEGFNLVFMGPTPGVELLAAGADVTRVGNRAWPLVEIVDRSDEGPGTGFLSPRTLAAIIATAESGQRVFVFTHRRLGFASTRCTRCRTLRICPECGFRVGRVDTCPKCEARVGVCGQCGGTEFEEMGTVPERLVAEINRKAGRELARIHPDHALVTVGTERDLAGIEDVHVAVAADVDGMLMSIAYRTSEEALRQLARLGSSLGRAKGARVMLQTSHPDSALVTTMRRGDPIPYLERVLVDRARDGWPPSTEMISIEVRGDVEIDIGADLSSLDPDAGVMGPMNVETGERWLLVGKLGKARLQLRKVVGRWRDRGATVRVDVDPIDV